MSQIPHIQQIRLEHSPELQELLRRHHKAFILLTVIAQRARRTRRDTILNLEPGQALIGDYKNYGMSEQQYRTAKNQLKRYELATFQSTNRGTVAQLCSTAVYDINAEPPNDPPNAYLTSIQRPPNDHVTTKKNENGNENEINTPQKSPQGDKNKEPTKAEKHDTAVGNVLIPTELNTDEFRGVFFDFCAERRERKQYVTDRALKGLLNKLKPHGVNIAIEALQESIANSYQGVFPNKHKQNPQLQPGQVQQENTPPPF